MNESTQQVLNFQKSLESIQKTFGSKAPDYSLVLGSGLNQMIDIFRIEKTIIYSDIPHLPKSHLQGHAGKLHLGKIHDKSVLIFSGRFHHYQGLPNYIASAPAWISGFWKIPVMISTNAAGGISKSYKTGDMVLINDHLFLQNDNPLRGIMLSDWQNPFVDMTKVYDGPLRKSLMKAAKSLKLPLHEGTYACVTGPTFETPAEIQMFKKMGADLVGMSTIPEVIVAKKLGIKVIGLSIIANMAAGISKDETISHLDVLASMQKNQARMAKLFSHWFQANS